MMMEMMNGTAAPSTATVSLGQVIENLVQRTYHELMVLGELLPRKTDMERKLEVFGYASRTRMLLVRLLALVKWASSAGKVDKCNAIMAYLDRQANLLVATADSLSVMSRGTLVKSTLPNFHLPAAAEILTTAKYSRVPRLDEKRPSYLNVEVQSSLKFWRPSYFSFFEV